MKKKKNGDIKKLLVKDEKIYFIRRLYELINHGYMLEDSIEFLMLQYSANDNTINYLKTELANGKKLSFILKKLGYPSSVVTKMEFAEHYGRIENMLLEIEKYLRIQKEQREKIVKTTRYPFFLTMTLIILITIFNLLVIPQFQNIYTSTNIKMDMQVSILINILYYLPKVLIGLILLIAILILYLTYLYRYKKARFLKLIIKIPLINNYFIYYISYQYSQELSLFLMSGFSMKTALNEIISKEYNYFFVEFSKKIEISLAAGDTFERATEKIIYLDKSMAKFINHGRKNSMLDKELSLYSDIMLDSFLKLVDKRLKKIQPVLFFILALIIIGLYLVILLPVFNMASSIR
ncbi:competence type IV pilus assembly protein ComGB [Gemella sp. zg-1178]|uniref:competence type IV pilus assembly protein ComGB n=1 Tax=Gemella sp. zg-1178 TaxID=2840372 RepID=UPI001C03FE1F|nr:competence type IV pilus assembly protein ComGB [Gemella sp. zg-1178]MBU0278924.1 type II secretion system F family protein [Gemella sp. zg-1178]